MASPKMAHFGDHIYVKKIILQLNTKRSQSVHMILFICIIYVTKSQKNQKDLWGIVGFSK